MKKYLSFIFIFIIVGIFVSCSNSQTITLSDQVKNFSSYKELNNYVDNYKDNINKNDTFYSMEGGDLARPETATDDTSNGAERNYSETNIQVEGVKESIYILRRTIYFKLLMLMILVLFIKKLLKMIIFLECTSIKVE